VSFNALRDCITRAFEAIGHIRLARTHRLWGEPASGPTGLRGVGGGAVGPLAPRSGLACSACWRPTRVGSACRKLSRVQPTNAEGRQGVIWLKLPSWETSFTFRKLSTDILAHRSLLGELRAAQGSSRSLAFRCSFFRLASTVLAQREADLCGSGSRNKGHFSGRPTSCNPARSCSCSFIMLQHTP
jgi:hypothetical protein